MSSTEKTTEREPCPTCGALPCDQVNDPGQTALTPGEVIRRIAEVAAAIGWQAGIGASETAGTIISVLAANPQIVDRFLADGAGTFIDGPISLDAVNGCLTYLAQTGEILSPAELAKRRHGNIAIQ